MAQLVEFDRRSAYQSPDPKITLQRGGNISLNAAAAALLEITEPTPIVFLWDEEGKRVGIKVAAEDSPNRYAMRHQPKSASFIVHAAAFCRFNGIPTEEAMRYDAQKYGKDTIGFSLNDQVQKVGRAAPASK